MKNIELNNENCEVYSDFLKDASQLKGTADCIYFCQSTEEVKEILNTCYKTNQPITTQGSLTGVCGGGVPFEGAIVNLSEMNRIKGMRFKNGFSVILEAGVSLQELNVFLKTKSVDTSGWTAESLDAYNHFQKESRYFFPPDPTETLASIGGMVMCDASGASSFKYGSIRPYVVGIRIITPNKDLSIQRGQYRYKDLTTLFDIDENSLPVWHRNHMVTKDVAGFYYEQDMDLIDLIIGSEGLLGIVTEVELKIIPEPESRIGIMLFLNRENKLAEFIAWLRNTLFEKPVAIEYFDNETLKLLSHFREEKKEIKALPIIKPEHYEAIYLEFHTHLDVVDDILMALCEVFEPFGIHPEEQWVTFDSKDLEKLKKFRHAAPECVNILISNLKKEYNNIHKVGTDMAVSDNDLSKALSLYRDDIEKFNLQACIFGHIGNNHLHVNIIPRDPENYKAAKALFEKWAFDITEMGGTISAEHGIGKTKRSLYHKIALKEDVDAMTKVKQFFDPKGLLNKGCLL